MADPDEAALAGRVQVGGVAVDLQLADNSRPLRIGQVDGVEGIGLPERDHVADRTDEPYRVDPLALAESVHRADRHEPVPVLGKNGDRAVRSLLGISVDRIECGGGPRSMGLLGLRTVFGTESRSQDYS